MTSKRYFRVRLCAALVGLWMGLLSFPSFAAFEGFHAMIGGIGGFGIGVTGTGWKQLRSWQTSGVKGLFQTSTAFDAGAGTYTAPQDGYYYFNANIIFNGVNDTSDVNQYVLASIYVNGDLQNLFRRSTIQNNPSPNFTLSSQGALFLKKGDVVTVWVYSGVDSAYAISTGSGFSGVFLGATVSSLFQAGGSTARILTTQWTQIKGWTAGGGYALSNIGGHFDAAQGTYTAPQDGYYHFSARVRIDNAEGANNDQDQFAKIAFAINGSIQQSISSYSPENRKQAYTATLQSTLYLRKNQVVSLWVSSSYDADYYINQESGWTGFYLFPTLDSGAYGALSQNTPAYLFDGTERALSGWTVGGNVGAFHVGQAWNGTRNVFVAPKRGIYKVGNTVNIKFSLPCPSCSPYPVFFLYPLVNGQSDNNFSRIGLSYHFGRSFNKTFSMKFEGFLVLNKGDEVSFMLRGTSYYGASSNTSYTYQVEAGSHFSIIFMDHTDLDRDGRDSSIDCNDDDDKIYPALNGQPGATEVCDGKDNNCDGKIDILPETCTEPTRVGICQQGVVACDANLQRYCLQKTLSQLEVCNGLDDNCDGMVDNIPGLDEVCDDTTRKGACTQGKWQCVSDKRVCVQTVQPSTEICNGIDDDCNGQIDDIADFAKPCEDPMRMGICKAGIWRCVSDQKVCVALQQAQTEVCNGQDDDCDGMIDNLPDLNQPCTDNTKQGPCQQGQWTCSNNQKLCVSQTQPTTELCDGIDNNCDGQIDNLPDLGKPCTDSTKQGPCQQGLWTCTNNQKVCVSQVLPATELCNGLDDDCDGQIDNGLSCGDAGNTDPCAKITCPANEICVQGACKPHPCEAVTCAAGEFCRDGTCVKSCLCPSCGLGESCKEGVCQSDVCGGKVCPNNQVCNPNTALCTVDPCLGVTCSAGMLCIQGTCQQDPCFLVRCTDPNEICILGQCYEKSCAPASPVESPSSTEKVAANEGTADAGNNDAPPPVGCQATPFASVFSWFFLLLLGLLLLPRYRLVRVSSPKSLERSR
ncbi:MAG: hypothetical protein H6728_17985 [Myxococcales bacterium]|nr:hypothetical protein [Myxococcales bacterium]